MPQNLFAGNGRVATLARWFKSVPDGSSELVLTVYDGNGGGEVLERWPAAAVEPELAQAVEEALDAYVEESKQSLTGSVKFLREDGTVLKSRKLRVRFRNDDDNELQEHLRFEGNAQSVLAQTQAHQQALMKTFVGMVEYTISTAMQQVGSNADEAARLRAKVEQLEGERLELETALLAAENDASGEGRELMKEGMQLMKLAAFKKASGGGTGGTGGNTSGTASGT